MPNNMSFSKVALFVVASLLHSRLGVSFPVTTHPQRTVSTKTALLAVSFSSHHTGGGDEVPEEEAHHPNRLAEFNGLEPIPHSSARKARMQQDSKNRIRFAKYGDDLWKLREAMNKLSTKLVASIQSGVREKEEDILQQLREVERQDPELVYRLELERLRKAQSEGRTSDAERHSKNAMAARSCLPQYNLDGLWVGKYGHHGYEMINITYSGDTMVAFKVTGDNNVPRGEVTFQVDLNPLPPKVVGDPSSSSPADAAAPLQPISLTEKAAKKWGTTQLPRYQGLGQVAEPGFNNNQWMDGQLIIIGEEYFSFAWVPIENQIFFGRPSPELALRMLRESSAATEPVSAKVWKTAPSMDEDVKVLKDYVASCLEKSTEIIEEDLKGDPFSCIWHGMQTEGCYFQ